MIHMFIQLLIAEIASFTLNVFSAFVFFAVGLLYFDSWHAEIRKRTLLFRSAGFFLMALVGVLHAPSLDVPWLTLLAQIVRISGLILILASLIREPLLQPPHTVVPVKKAAVITHGRIVYVIPFILPLISASLVPISAVLTLLIAATYLRKTTDGHEKQIRPVFWAFFFLGLSETLRVTFAWSDTAIVYWSKILMPYGVFWGIQRILQFTGICILAMWAWGYIRFRLQLQLFVSVMALSLTLFLTTTVFYTFLLLRNMEVDAFAHLETDVRVLEYSLESVKERTRSYAQTVAQDGAVRQALLSQDKPELYRLMTEYMISQNATTMLITSSSGGVIMRAEDKDRTNDSVASDSLVQHALTGESVSTVFYDKGITVPEVSVHAAVPVRVGTKTDDAIIGVVITGITIDSAFVDGVKAVTGLDVAVFGGNTRAATTFIAPDGKSRLVGTRETNSRVLDTVLGRGEVYVGSSQVLNRPFYTAYAPLVSYDKKFIGMLFVGKLQTTLIDAAKKSIELTFLGSIVLIILTLIPAYFLSRYLNDHTEV